MLRAVAQPPPAHVQDDIRQLLAMATGGREDELRIALLDYAGRAGDPQRADSPEGARPVLRAVPIEIGERGQPAAIGS